MYFEDRVKRIDWIDCSKGIAILLVILGHTVVGSGTEFERVLRGGIFSFHMPLFFILSSVTFKLSMDSSQFREKSKKAFSHLVIPALILYGLRTLINIINNFASIEWSSYIIEKISVLVWGSGVNVVISDAEIPAFGMMWFFIALFSGRTLCDYLHLKLKHSMFILAVFIFTTAGVILGRVLWLPFSLDIALAAMPFFWFGEYLKKVDINRKSVMLCVISLIVWGITFSVSFIAGNDYLELAGRRYPFFPLCYITAIAGTMFVAYFSQLLLKMGNVTKPLVYIGRNSIWLYCVHAMDYIYGFIWSMTGNNMVNGIIRIVMDVIVCIIMIKTMEIIIPALRKQRMGMQ